MTQRAKSNTNPREVRCPTCGAPPKQGCRAVTVDELGGIEIERPLRPITGVHSGRKRQAAIEGGE